MATFAVAPAPAFAALARPSQSVAKKAAAASVGSKAGSAFVARSQSVGFAASSLVSRLQTLTLAPAPKSSQSTMPVVVAAGQKLKTRKAAAKRFKITASGKIIRRKAGKAHLLRKKNGNKKLIMSKEAEVTGGDARAIRKELPNFKKR
eukprot:jgi/Mesvir1/22362/Mv17864-RA.1